jgi:hypothetical protein
MILYRYGRRFIDPQDKYRRWIDPRVRTLRLADVVAYLRRRGWIEVSPDRPGFRVFQEPPGAHEGGELFYQFVPDSEGYADYPLRMFELLTGLAEVEDRQAREVIDDILRQTGADAVPANGPAVPTKAEPAPK